MSTMTAQSQFHRQMETKHSDPGAAGDDGRGSRLIINHQSAILTESLPAAHLETSPAAAAFQRPEQPAPHPGHERVA
jgi:hypothetical protein